MNKISVMIVDDEKLAIDDLINIVDWEEIGFEIIATAINGKQALSKFQKAHPQVVLTDIKMPYMDGIELIQRLRKIDTKTKILLLTAYREFSYAKSAIHYGITDYIIKSEINYQTFRDTLIKLRKLIESEDQSSEILRAKRISDYFNSNIEEGQLSDKELFFTPHFYLIVEQDLPINISGDNYSEQTRYQDTDIISVLTATEENDCVIAAVGSLQHDQILLAIDIWETSQTAIRTLMVKCAERMKLLLEKHFQSTFTFFRVDTKIDLVGLKKIYISGRQRFLTKYLSSSGGIYNFLDNGPEQTRGNVKADDSIDENVLGELMNKMDIQELRLYIDQLFERILVSHSYTNLCNASKVLYDVLRKHIKTLPENVKKLDISAEQNWTFWLNGSSINRWFDEKFETLIDEKKRLYESGYSRVIVKAIDYLYKHFDHNDLSIYQVAEEVHLSIGHLCALFKKETGKTVNTFITETRINEAKRLLKEGNLKVYEVSAAVGYQSSQYFSQVFYKLTGVYPAAFQKGKKSD